MAITLLKGSVAETVAISQVHSRPQSAVSEVTATGRSENSASSEGVDNQIEGLACRAVRELQPTAAAVQFAADDRQPRAKWDLDSAHSFIERIKQRCSVNADSK